MYGNAAKSIKQIDTNRSQRMKGHQVENHNKYATVFNILKIQILNMHRESKNNNNSKK